MGVSHNITMKEFNGTDYDTLNPKTLDSQVELTGDAAGNWNVGTVNEALDVLGDYNLYAWELQSTTVSYYLAFGANFKQSWYLGHTMASDSPTISIAYYDTLTVNSTTGAISVSGPHTMTVSYSTYTNLNNLKGKYYQDSGVYYYVDSSAVASRERELIPDSTEYDYTVYLTKNQPCIVASTTAGTGIDDRSIATSSRINAYPVYSTVNGITYRFLGKAYDNLFTCLRQAHGQYTGTGSTSVTLDIGFRPLMVFLFTDDGTGNISGSINSTVFRGVASSGAFSATATWTDTALTLVDTNAKHNTSGKTYTWVAIG